MRLMRAHMRFAHRYEGEWKDGKMHNKGVYYYSNGDKYDGEWRDDKRHGKGVVTYAGPNGTVQEKYEGDWVDGKMHGWGKYFYADTGYAAVCHTTHSFSTRNTTQSVRGRVG